MNDEIGLESNIRKRQGYGAFWSYLICRAAIANQVGTVQEAADGAKVFVTVKRVHDTMAIAVGL